MMDTPFPSMLGLARRLLALEAASQTAIEAPQPDAILVLEKLRNALSRFAGADGFSALLRRALALARADFPALQTVSVRADGRLEGLEALFADGDPAGADATAATIAYLLELLVTFVGRPLTLRLVREAWPDAIVDV